MKLKEFKHLLKSSNDKENKIDLEGKIFQLQRELVELERSKLSRQMETLQTEIKIIQEKF